MLLIRPGLNGSQLKGRPLQNRDVLGMLWMGDPVPGMMLNLGVLGVYCVSGLRHRSEILAFHVQQQPRVQQSPPAGYAPVTREFELREIEVAGGILHWRGHVIGPVDRMQLLYRIMPQAPQEFRQLYAPESLKKRGTLAERRLKRYGNTALPGREDVERALNALTVSPEGKIKPGDGGAGT